MTRRTHQEGTPPSPSNLVIGMKAVLGVDLAGNYQFALDLLKRLQIPGLEVVAFHAVPSVLPDGGFPSVGPAHPVGNMIAELQQNGQQKLDEVKADLDSAGIPCEAVLEFGDACAQIHAYCDAHPVELVAVGSERKSAWESFLFGSVAKGLTISMETSLLVAERPKSQHEGLRLLIATDHSAYGDECLKMIAGLQAKGIAKIDVVHVINPLEAAVSMDFGGYVPEIASAALQMRERSVAMNEELAESLSALGAEVSTHIWQAENGVKNAIVECAKSLESDLVVVGAQGHGFVERKLMGSTSYDLVVDTDLSVLILRK